MDNNGETIWTKFVRWINIPIDSSPGDFKLFIFATVPAFHWTIFLRMIGVEFFYVMGLNLSIALLLRFSPWFNRPKGVLVNIMIGWLMGTLAWKVLYYLYFINHYECLGVSN